MRCHSNGLREYGAIKWNAFAFERFAGHSIESTEADSRKLNGFTCFAYDFFRLIRSNRFRSRKQSARPAERRAPASSLVRGTQNL